MIPVSTEYRRQLIAGNRNWLIKVPVFLAGNSSSTPDFTLTNEHIWDNGIVLDNAISGDSSFDIGSAIVGSLKVVIDNIEGNFSQYDFYDAKLTLYLGVTGDLDDQDVQRYYRIGFYVVDVPNYNGSLITLNCLDNMTWFDVPFEDVTGISYPSTAGQVVAEICSHVGVTLGTASFPNYTTVIPAKPEQTLGCREVIQYIAQMCCCYCKINTAGELILAWYDKSAITGITDYDGGTFNTNTTPYSDGCDLDGGSFNPWTTGDTADGGLFTDLQNRVFISQNYEIEVSTDDVVVTGCRVRNNSSKEDSYDETWVDPSVEANHPRYVLVIENNPFITTQVQASAIANVVGSILAGLPIRGYSATSLADFSYETGDMATVVDFRGNRYYSWLTHTTFTTNNSEKFSCGVESVRERSEQRFSTSAEMIEKAKVALTEYDKAVKAMNELAQNSIGYNEYVYPTTGNKVTWRYNGTNIDTTIPTDPKFPTDTTVVFKISGDGVFVSNSIDTTTGEVTYTNGYDANSGTAILSLIYAIGINCDWIHAGTLTLGGYDDVNGLCSVLDGSGTEQVKLDHTGIEVKKGTITGATITSYVNNDASRGYTEISGGSVKVVSDANNYLRIVDKSDNSHYVAIGPDIAVRKDSDSFYIQRDTEYLGWAIEDAYNAHSSDKKLKKKIKDIPVKNSRDLILGARPRYYEFKKSTENGIRSGFVAQELRETLDDIGNTTAIERESVRREGEREVLYEDFIAHLVNTTKDLYKQVDSLKQELAELKARIK